MDIGPRSYLVLMGTQEIGRRRRRMRQRQRLGNIMRRCRRALLLKYKLLYEVSMRFSWRGKGFSGDISRESRTWFVS